MAANEYYQAGPGGHFEDGSRVGSQPSRLPRLPIPQYSPVRSDHAYDSPVSPAFDAATPLRNTRTTGSDESDSQYFTAGRTGATMDSRQYSDDIPLKDNPHLGSASGESDKRPMTNADDTLPSPAAGRPRRKRPREPEKKGFFSGKIPWVVYFFTLVQTTIFIAEIVKNSIVTKSPIQIRPQFNPMIGPSYYVLINMGARFIPCMKNLPPVPNVDWTKIDWPCPWAVSGDAKNEDMQCKLETLCGFEPLGNPPNQWYRFIIPIFLHGGLIHIGFNMLLQLTLGREIEKIIGSLRFLLVYMSSGIFGFVLGGNFAANGLVAIGASGSLFGIIAISLLDLLYKWKERRSPWKELIFIILDIVISFVLGLLPGLDNFSHIGGFLMGLVLGICILHSPNTLREHISSDSSHNPISTKRSRSRRKNKGFKSFAKDPIGFFKDRKPLWWAWWLVRAGALLGVLICFIVLLRNFYTYQNTCSWCKYLSCLNVNHWCDMNDLENMLISKNETTQNPKRDLLGLQPTDLLQFI